MPYEVISHCAACQAGDEFVIGLWPKHLGVFVCPQCRALQNITLESGRCPGCGVAPDVTRFYDYAPAIPYLGGAFLSPLEPGPDCPKCRGGPLAFRTKSHLNVGRLGAAGSDQVGWRGRDYLEKAIFVRALLVVCSEFQLSPDDMLGYFNVDVPGTLMSGRGVSYPILLDIRAHLLAVGMSGEAPFPVTDQLHAAIFREYGDLLQGLRPSKRWWEFWK